MEKEFEPVVTEIPVLIDVWEPRLKRLSGTILNDWKNAQGRTIKQILGHMVDSATNNTHRMVHLQYQDSPLVFPNYATNGNNDRWIAIQNYQDKDWLQLIQLWKYSNLHVVHVIRNINPAKLDQEWIAGHREFVSLKLMAIDFLRHFKLHLHEIEELMKMG